MRTFITTSSATEPLGIPTGRKALRIVDGVYADRLAFLYQNSAGSISLRYADPPYRSWSTAQVVASDSADSSFDCWMNSAGEIYLVYTADTSFDLLFRKITFSGGAWVSGSAVTVYATDDCYFPSIALEKPDRLWVSYTRVSGGSSYINALKSDNWGDTWGVGAGETLTDAGTSAYSQVVVSSDLIHVVFTLSGAKLAVKDKEYLSGLFNAEKELATGTGFDENFHLALSSDGRVGVVYDDGQLRYRSYDGSQWTAVQVIDSAGGAEPRLIYSNNSPYVIYAQSAGSNQTRLLHSTDNGQGFSSPVRLLDSRDDFAAATLYNSSGASYADLTAEAASNTSADVFHATSGALAKDSGDTLYLGMADKFNFIHVILSTSGAGGALSWQYYDGSSWVSFTPASGATNLTSSEEDILLWDDLSSVPGPWQMVTVNGATLFFVRAVVSSAYSTAPVGSQFTALPQTTALISEV